jgi:hypothetical protein
MAHKYQGTTCSATIAVDPNLRKYAHSDSHRPVALYQGTTLVGPYWGSQRGLQPLRSVFAAMRGATFTQRALKAHTSTQRALRALKAHTSTQRAHRALRAHTSTQRAHRALRAHTSTPQRCALPWRLETNKSLFPAPSSPRKVHFSQPTFVRPQGDPCCINLRRTLSR